MSGEPHPERYRTLAARGTGDFRDRGSKFPSWAVPCDGEAMLRALLAELRRAHPTARHHCFGAVFGEDGVSRRANDDGEPSGTAGLPIVNAILAAGLTDAAVLVARYFGGTRLGKPGLIHAYQASARDALANARAVIRHRCETVIFDLDYPRTGAVMRWIERTPHARVEAQVFEARCRVEAAVPRSACADAVRAFEHTGAVRVALAGDGEV